MSTCPDDSSDSTLADILQFVDLQNSGKIQLLNLPGLYIHSQAIPHKTPSLAASWHPHTMACTHSQLLRSRRLMRCSRIDRC